MASDQKHKHFSDYYYTDNVKQCLKNSGCHSTMAPRTFTVVLGIYSKVRSGGTGA